jgi:hypothetical protein
MDESNDILKALSQVPELTEAAKRILAANEEFKKLVADMMKQRVQAEVSQDQVQKVCNAVIEAVRKTSCQLPDTKALSEQIARQTISLFSLSIKEAAEEAVKKAVEKHPVEHVFTYARTWDLIKVAEKKLKGQIIAVLMVNVILLVGCAILGYAYFQPKQKMGRRYMEIIRSKYTTEEERNKLWKGVYVLSAFPVEYFDTPVVVNSKVTRNEEILRLRETEAKANKGKYSTKIPLER